MKILALLLIAIIISKVSPGQNFEGEIIYHNTYISKIPNMTDEKFALLMGPTQDYFLKDAKYKSILDGTLLQWQIYVSAENKMYTKMSNNEAAIWTDAGINSDSVISMDLNKNAIDILGYRCDELIFNCKSGIQKYYFSSKLSIDPKKYVNLKYGNWYTFVSKSKAVPLKIEIDNAQFSMTSTAVEVKPMNLDNSIFQLPVGIKTEKSPY